MGNSAFQDDIIIRKKNIVSQNLATVNYQKTCPEYLVKTGLTEFKIDTISELKQVINAGDVRIFHERDSTIKLDSDNHIAYCLQPKAGTTNWSKMALAIKQNVSFRAIDGDLPMKAVYSHNPNVNQVGRSALNLGIKSFNFNYKTMDQLDVDFGVLLTRHPLTRLYSCWSHRFSNSHHDHEKYFNFHIKHIQAHYAKPDDSMPPPGIFVSFAAFLRFVASDEAHQNYKLYNQHWAKVTTLCFPCQLQFWNNIVKTETAEKDGNEILRKTGYSHVGRFPSAYGPGNRNSRGFIEQKFDVEQHYLDIRTYIKDNIDKNIITAVYDQYYWDFRLFGYNLDGFL